ncbi:hypothetical protein L5515_011161 [Caenorhabditis briggsae]|uniref:F-box domain-containing protein n=1 Tax=Caenorhabditis briggsae TaxID=6238 RepID=A0AAE9EP42_CAEBR|nr:hypothetical protein L5515_011161 [Caenorhabditis briggsae]
MHLDQLAPEILHEIFSYLSHRERLPVKLCSKALNVAATVAPLALGNVHFMEYFDEFDEANQGVSIVLRTDEFEMNFNSPGYKSRDTLMDVYLQNARRRHRTETVENEGIRDLARKYLRKLILPTNVSCDNFETNYRYTPNFLENSEIIKTKKFRVLKSGKPQNAGSIHGWLRHLKPNNLRNITVYKSDEDFSFVGFENGLSSLETLHVLQKSSINDDVLLSLKALDIELEQAEITANGINTLIQRWTTQSVPRGSRFVYYYVAPPGSFPIHQLVQNVRDVSLWTENKANIPIGSDRTLNVYVDSKVLHVECFKK